MTLGMVDRVRASARDGAVAQVLFISPYGVVVCSFGKKVTWNVNVLLSCTPGK